MFSNLLPEEDSKAEPTRLNASFFILTRYQVEQVEVGAQNAGTNSSSKVFVIWFVFGRFSCSEFS